MRAAQRASFAVVAVVFAALLTLAAPAAAGADANQQVRPNELDALQAQLDSCNGGTYGVVVNVDTTSSGETFGVVGIGN